MSASGLAVAVMGEVGGPLRGGVSGLSVEAIGELIASGAARRRIGGWAR